MTVNAEALAQSVTEAGWALEARGNLGLRTGNVELLNVGGAASLRHQTLFEEPARMRTRFLVIGNYRRLVVFGEPFTHQGLAHLRYTHQLVPRFGLDGFAQVEFDELARLRQRSVAGAGVRVVVLQDEHVGAWLGSGYLVEDEDWNVPSTETFDAHQLNHRWTNYLSLRVATGGDHLVVTDTAYAQPRFDAFGNVHVLNEVGLRVAAAPHLSFTTTFSTRYESRVPPGVAEVDTSLRSGFALSLPITREGS